MKTKLITAVLCAALLLSIGGGCLAAETLDAPAAAPCPDHPLGQLQQKFDSLSDDQKQQLYAAGEEFAAACGQLIAKYAEAGLITAQQAQELTEAINTALKNARQEGRLFLGVLPGAHRPGYKRAPGPRKPENA